ncbi:hypothetical protein EMMF5_001259 [Cystobasidiomycetes sp. EMM_F5]
MSMATINDRAIQSEPESNTSHRSSSHLNLDDSFLELIDAARLAEDSIGMSATVRPVATARDTDMRNDRSIAPFIEAPPSPQAPASMSASTAFALSSNDSPPSQGFMSSANSDSSDEGESDTQAARPRQSPPLSSAAEADSQPTEGSVDTSGTSESSTNGHDASTSPSIMSSWWHWLMRHVLKLTVGAGLIGIGYLFASNASFTQRKLACVDGTESLFPPSSRIERSVLSRFRTQLTPFE